MSKTEILFLSHCILNTASKVADFENAHEAERQLHLRLIKMALDKDIQLIQLPCPEFLLLGSRRFGHVKDQFMYPFFREQCRKMLHPIILQIKEYSTYPEEFKLLGIVGVQGSPSCGISLTCRAPWKGEISMQLADPLKPLDQVKMSKEKGVFIEVIEEEITASGLSIPLLSAEEALALAQGHSV